MDPFTQRMMERARLRREKLDSEMAAAGQTDAKRRRVPLLENNPINTSPQSACTISKPSRKMASPEKKTKSPKVSIAEIENDGENMQYAPTINNVGLHNKLNRLGKLYAGPENLESLSSPVHKPTETLSRYKEETFNSVSKVTSSARTARLAALAKSIEEWEDDLSTIAPTPKREAPKPTISKPSPMKSIVSGTLKVAPASPVKSVTPVKMPTRALVSSPAQSATPVMGSPVNSPTSTSSSPRSVVQMGSRALQSPVRVTSFVKKATTKTIVWDQAVIATLESQGFVPTQSRSRLIYDFERDSSSLQEEEQHNLMKKMEGDVELEEDDDACPESPCTGSVSSPGWVYRAGSPAKVSDQLRPSPKMGLQSPAKKIVAASNTSSPVKPCSPIRSPTKLPKDVKNISPGSVLQRAAMFESAAASSSSPVKDPAELTLSQRMALFEKNKSQGPLIPKVAFSTPLPAKLIPQGQTKPSQIINLPKAVEKPVQDSIGPVAPKGLVSAATKVLAQKAMFEKNAKQPQKHTEVVAASLTERQKELEVLRSRWDKQKQMCGKPIENKPHEERVQIEHMRQRWANETHGGVEPGTPPPPPPLPSSGPCVSPTKNATRSVPPTKNYPGVGDVRKIRLSPPKSGRMYPSLSDIEATESEMDASISSGNTEEDSSHTDLSTSFGDEILQAAGVQREMVSNKRAAVAMTASECAVLNEIDEFLEEALGSDSESNYAGPTPPKKSRDLQEDISQFRTPAPPAPAPLPPSQKYGGEDNSNTPLMHTVSFYRKQKAQGSRLATPVKQIVRHEESESDSDEEVSETMQKAVQKKLGKLFEDVSKQQTIISQASQALNLCRSTLEFSNSPEQVEAERLLLVATQRRQSLLHEIERLKVERTLYAHGEHTETGSLKISNLALPLKQEFLSRIRRGQEGNYIYGVTKPTLSFKPLFLSRNPTSVAKCMLDDTEHYFVCLVKCQEQLLVSPLMATSSVSSQKEMVHFPGTLTLESLGSDFKIMLEVYTLKTQKETMSHEQKYHIRTDMSNKKRSTPKKQKNDNLLVMPIVQSPAGPSAVRSTSFALAGYTVFSLREMARTQFTLSKVPYSSPLEGHVLMKLTGELHLDTEQRGFLSMFEDIRGLGAWHRRWCVLNGSRLAYWKYPDDERIKEPMGWLDLKNSCTKTVGPVSRDICAHSYTFLLETRREPRVGDKDSLVMIPGEQYTTLRHLLSADTKSERDQWCNELNRALSSMRAWRASTSSNKSAIATAL